MTAPEGRGAAATYGYVHLLQLIQIKLRQMDGGTLSAIATELGPTNIDQLENEVATALGVGLPKPKLLNISDPTSARGRSGRAIHTWQGLGQNAESHTDEGRHRFAITKWHRVPVVRGLELHVHEGHPLADFLLRSREISDIIRVAVNRFLASQSRR